MKARCLLVIAAAALCGLWLLALRQQRIALIHTMSDLHRELDTTRAKLWRARADVASLVAPPRLPAMEEEAWTPATPANPDGLEQAAP
ncbi:MAG: hypothetical protein QF733_02525 [Phycisphaerales bacterium]|jgi:hypothetical protein|nr:hypothetical protein [Phycisphaerales bacterium]